MSTTGAVGIPGNGEERLQGPAGLRRFLIWFTPVVVAFAIVEAIAFSATGAASLAGAAVISATVAVAMAGSFGLLRRGDVQRAVLVACASILTGALALGLLLPQLEASIVLAPVLVTALALLYLDRGNLVGMVVLAGGSAIGLAIAQEILPQAAVTSVWFDGLYRVGALAALVVPTLYLLWLASERQSDALDRAVSAQAGVAAAETKLVAANVELAGRVGELQQRNREINILSELTELLEGIKTGDEAYEAIGRSGSLLMPDATGAVYLISPSHDQLALAVSWGPVIHERAPFDIGDCWALRRGRAYVSGGAVQFRCPHLSAAAPMLASLCVPLVAHGETLGILELLQPAPDTPEADTVTSDAAGEPLEVPRGSDEWRAEATAFPDGRRGLILTFAEHTALFVANFRLHEKLLIQSTRDPLTGLYNRRFMEESLERELRRAERGSYDLAVMMLDLDLFKAFNDSHGHDAGDAKLRALGEFLRGHVRGEDIACRYGGEEFTIILPGASLDDARHRADLLRVGIRNLATRDGGATHDPVTASIGLAMYPLHGSTAQELLRAADEALYDAKRRGRDRIRQAATRV